MVFVLFFQPIYQMTAQELDLRAFTDADYNSLRSSIYSPDIGPTVEVILYFSLRRNSNMNKFLIG